MPFHRRYTRSERQAAVADYLAGLTIAETATEHVMSESSVRDFVRRAGYEPEEVYKQRRRNEPLKRPSAQDRIKRKTERADRLRKSAKRMDMSKKELNEFEQRIVDAYKDPTIPVGEILSWEGVTERNFRKAIKKAKCPPRPKAGKIVLSAEEEKKVRDMVADGAHAAQIVKETGIPRFVLKRFCEENNLSPKKGVARTKRVTRYALDEKILDLACQGLDQVQIAEALDVDIDLVANCLWLHSEEGCRTLKGDADDVAANEVARMQSMMPAEFYAASPLAEIL